MTTQLADALTLRRAFQLPEEDVEGLDARGFAWETVVEAGVKWLMIAGYAVPSGYNYNKADLALRIPPSYPDDQIDMVYFSPALALTNGKAIRQLSLTRIDGKEYQQWSRHRTPQNPWRPGLDSICTHLLQVDTWLARELN
jgi:hypothetical protein